MEAKDLMIGDWVYNKNIDNPMQIYPTIFPQMFRRKPNASTEDYNIFPGNITNRRKKDTALRRAARFAGNAGIRCGYLLYSG